MFWFVKTVHTNIQQDQKAKLDYHISMLFAYMAGWRPGSGRGRGGGRGAGGGGRGLEVLKCFVRGGQNFFYLLCVCVGGGTGGGG